MMFSPKSCTHAKHSWCLVKEIRTSTKDEGVDKERNVNEDVKEGVYIDTFTNPIAYEISFDEVVSY